MKVLYEDNHLLVVDKPTGMATMGAAQRSSPPTRGPAGAASVYDWAADYLKRRYHKPGNVFVGVVSRLDQVTSGVLVLARTSKAASRLSIQFGGPGKSRKVTTRAQKLYLAVLQGDLVGDSGLARSGTLVDSVWKDDAAHRMRVARGDRPDAKEARLEYEVLDHAAGRTLVAVRLLTGRKHQIRLQFAHRGRPLLGDRKYGSTRPFAGGVALHSWRLLITHPTRQAPLLFSASPPPDWSAVAPPLPPESHLLARLSSQSHWDDALLEPRAPEP